MLVEDMILLLCREITQAPCAMTLIEGEHTKIIEITPTEGKDVGRLIGKHGKTVAALREIANVLVGAQGCHVKIDILDTEGGD